MNRTIDDKIIILFRKIICSLSCIEKISDDKKIQSEVNKYLMKFIEQYELYRNTKDINNLKFSYNISVLIDLCNDCYSKIDIFDFAEDVEYGIKELIEIINKERSK